MATIADRSPRIFPDEFSSMPKSKPLWAKLGRLALDNPVGALALLVVLAFVVLGVIGSSLAPYDPKALSVQEQYLAPSSTHVFGTTKFGFDVFSRVLAGARIDLKFGVIVLILGFVPGTLLGIISGYFGRWVDYLIQRSAEAWTAFPVLFLLLAFIAAFGPGLKTVEIVVAISALFSGSRILRAVAIIEKHKEYIAAARSTGATELRILWRHVIPNIMPFILVGLSGFFAIAVLAESTLSFLGLGVTPGEPSWGADLSIALRREAGDKHPWLIIFPGAAISLVVLAFNLLGDTLRDILDPRLRGSVGARK